MQSGLLIPLPLSLSLCLSLSRALLSARYFFHFGIFFMTQYHNNFNILYYLTYIKYIIMR